MKKPENSERSSSFDFIILVLIFHSMAIRLFKLVREINTPELVSINFRYSLFLSHFNRIEIRLNSPFDWDESKNLH